MAKRYKVHVEAGMSTGHWAILLSVMPWVWETTANFKGVHKARKSEVNVVIRFLCFFLSITVDLKKSKWYTIKD